jgi:hypothetical protein
MNQALRQKAVVKPGGIIEINSPELLPGTTVDVIVIVENLPQKRRSLRSMIGTGNGSFTTPKEVDEFSSRERDSWSF